MTGLVVAALLLAEPAATEARRPVAIEPIEGLHADSLERRDFLEAFHQALAEGEFVLEAAAARGRQAERALASRFRPLDGARSRDAWSLRVVLTLPPVFVTNRRTVGSDPRGQVEPRTERRAVPDRRVSRRMHVAVVVRDPREVLNEATPPARETHVAFPLPPPALEGIPAPPTRGYPFPWAEAGRVAGLLAIEALHHRTRDLAAVRRLEIPPAIRVETGD